MQLSTPGDLPPMLEQRRTTVCERAAAPDQRPGLLFEAARRAEIELGDRDRAATILERVASEYPETRLGRNAVREAARLRSR